MYVLLYLHAVGSHPLDFLSWSGEPVNLTPGVDCHVATLWSGHYQAAHGRLDVLHVKVLTMQLRAEVYGIAPVQHHWHRRKRQRRGAKVKSDAGDGEMKYPTQRPTWADSILEMVTAMSEANRL